MQWGIANANLSSAVMVIKQWILLTRTPHSLHNRTFKVNLERPETRLIKHYWHYSNIVQTFEGGGVGGNGLNKLTFNCICCNLKRRYYSFIAKQKWRYRLTTLLLVSMVIWLCQCNACRFMHVAFTISPTHPMYVGCRDIFFLETK